MSCQTSCQTCESVCQNTCQDSCEAFCQTACQICNTCESCDICDSCNTCESSETSTQQISVIYNANGGEVSPENITVVAGTAVTMPTPTKSGYIFHGWYTAISGGIKIGNAGVSYTVTSNITLYAQWREMTVNEMLNNFENDSTYNTKYAYYVNVTKKSTLVSIGRALANYGYAPTFIAGFLGHITPEGNIGYFERNWGTPSQTYLLNWDDLDWGNISTPNYDSDYSGQYIMNKDFETVKEILEVLKDNNWVKKFGLGCCQWTAERTSTLVNEYYSNVKSGNNITINEASSAEAEMIHDELQSVSYSSIITKWNTICIHENADLKSEEAAYWAGFCILIGFGLNPAWIDTNNSPTYVRSDLSSTWSSWADTRGEYARDVYKIMIGESII